MGRLDGKVAIVTGGARGMGAAEAHRLAQEGASVVVADILDDEGRQVAAKIGKAAIYVHLDATSESDWTRAVEAAMTSFGRLDILVNNAGMLLVAPVMEMTAAQFRKVNEVNLIGPFLGIKAAVPKMREGGGSIINIASINGLRGSPALAAYSASKHGLLGLTRSVAMELGPLGIRVNAVCPGGIKTPMVAEVAAVTKTDLSDVHAAFAQKVSLGRMGDPEDMAGIVVFLASDDSKYCNGAEFVVDGGFISAV